MTRFTDTGIVTSTTPHYTADLETEAGAPLGVLDALTLDLIDTLSGVVINGVDGVNILNTGRGTLSVEGVLRVNFLPEDLAPHATSRRLEERTMILRWRRGAEYGAHVVIFDVENPRPIGATA